MRNNQKRTKASENEDKLRSLKGTFAAEGIALSESTYKNIARIENGQAGYKDVLDELKMKYERNV